METLNSNVIRKMKILSYNINKCTQSKEKKSYPQILFDALKNYEQYIRKFPRLICGDFNCYVGQSGVSETTGTFEQCIDFLKDHNLYSLYHERTGEE